MAKEGRESSGDKDLPVLEDELWEGVLIKSKCISLCLSEVEELCFQKAPSPCTTPPRLRACFLATGSSERDEGSAHNSGLFGFFPFCFILFISELICAVIRK